ncbi:MAG TPA: phage holin family protein [Chloroflexi bacterium]|jgi:putative membrane protein|nr:phage holin family protein [Chloroflexota bacterium]
MRRALVRWVINAVAIWAAIMVVPGLNADGGWTVYLWVALILGLVNALIAPIVKALTCPLILLTLGLFTLVINGAMLWLAGVLSREFGLGFFVRDLGAAILGALVVSVVSFVLSVLAGVHRKER